MAEPIDGLIDVADGEEYIVTANQADQLVLLLVDVLKFVQHDLAELRADAFTYLGIALQKLNGAAFEVIEVELGGGGFAIAVEFLEVFQDVEKHGAVRRDMKIDSVRPLRA